MFREAGTQVSPVTMSHPSLRTAAPPCLPLGTKDSLKEDSRLLLWRLCFGDFCFLLKGFAFDFLRGKAFWYRRLLEGKRIVKGKRLLKEKESLKGNC
jgi:hypothetical protein